MDPVDLNAAADAYATAPLLNCLLREVADAEGGGVHRLRASGRLLRVAGGRRPADPELRTADGWRPLGPPQQVEL
ncbi:IucA/IucC family siderophore biosynthesis protein, partial [Streptomyces sp. NPDC059708]